MKKVSFSKWSIALSSVGVFLLLVILPFVCNFSSSEPHFVHIDKNDTFDSVRHKIKGTAGFFAQTTFEVLAKVTSYANHIKPGRYDIGSGQSVLRVFRHLRNGRQSPVRLTIPILRTPEDLANFLGKKFAASPADFYATLTDTAFLQTLTNGRHPETVLTIFLPNTYEIYWTTSPKELVQRMNRESKVFWNDTRLSHAKQLHLTPEEVVTVASIVEQETDHNPEKPRVAGMYLNRLHADMPLQADPTVKYAVGDFSLKRVLRKHLSIESPYNTYRHKGLPPGPICIPSLSSIEAVLNAEQHSYLYMCAKEDFSGTHNFAVTYEEHQRNAERYTNALDNHGIR